MSGKTATYSERTMLRLPTGTLERIQREAQRQRTSPAEVMRRAIVATAERAPGPSLEQGETA